MTDTPHQTRSAHTWWSCIMMVSLLASGILPAGDSLVNYGPTAFVYYPPKDVDGVPGHVQKIFSWSESYDPEGGIITYKLRIYQNDAMIYQKDDIVATFCAVDLTAEIPEYDPNEDFTFEILAEDPFWQEVQPTLAVSPSRDSDLTGVSSVTVPAYVWGYVYDSETNEPLTDALVYTANSSTATEDGTYGLRVQAGTVTMIVSASGYDPQTFEYDLEEGDVQLQNVALYPSFFNYKATLWGAIRDETTDNLVSNARLYYNDEEFDVDGGSYILNLTEGSYELRCVAPGYEETTVELTLQRNTTVQGDFTLVATDEHAWAARQTYDASEPDVAADPRQLDVAFSGMEGEYDIYIAAQVDAGALYYLTDFSASWSTELTPLLTSTAIPDGNYSLLMMNVLTTLGDTTILVVCTQPGADPLDVANWEAYAIIDWN